MTPHRLGPYLVERPIGRGGNGEVWRGRHREHGTPVAIKVLSNRVAARPGARESFRNEVRAVASLSHPAIVVVYDHGEVSPEEARDRLPMGSPWLAMELSELGPLSAATATGWGQVRRVVVDLLEALAHAHARGVIHRDLKSSNVLRTPDGIKLTDFGMAHIVDRPERQSAGPSGSAGGTPGYMAPEQFLHAWRDFGPWTDLYALGCLAWALCAGAPPFRAGSWPAAARGHLYDPVPAFVAGSAVPAELEGWLRVLLAKDPAERFQCAADALAALPAGQENGGGSRPARSTPEPLSTAETVLREPTPVPASRREAVLRIGRPPPVPEDWRAPGALPDPPALVGGTSLFGLRPVPLVGREAERDALWSELRAVHASRRPRCVLLRGPAGCGKSRLADWICQRAREVGAAHVLRAYHSERPGSTDGVSAMIARDIGATGLTREEAAARAERWLAQRRERDPMEIGALTELVAPADRDGDAPAPFFGTRERHGAVIRHLRRRGVERPSALWLDDIQWGLDALELAAAVMDEPVPVLIVLTARDEALADRPDETSLVRALAPVTREIRVDPLPAEARPALVRGLLHLEADLADEVVARTGGNPLFAVHLVGDWVHRRLLVRGRRGYRLRRGGQVELPDDLVALWRRRVERVLAGRPSSDRDALELAAMLGQVVDDDEWIDACSEAERLPAPGLIDDLVLHRLAVRTEPERFSFVHGLVREALERGAREAGRHLDQHRACARMLRGRRGPGVSERVARHLVEAGDHEAALEPLNEAIDENIRRGPFRNAVTLCGLLARALAAAGLAAEDPRRASHPFWTARIHNMQGDLAASDVAAAELEQLARRYGWEVWLVRALRERAYTATEQGRYARSEALLREAIDLARRLGEPSLVVLVCRQIGRVEIQRGHLDRALDIVEEGLEAARDLGAAQVWQIAASKAHVLAALGRSAEAESLFLQVLEHHRSVGHREGMGVVLNSLGDISRSEGDLRLAAERYEQARDVFEAAGCAQAPYPKVNLALTLLEQGRVEAADPLLAALLGEVQGSGLRVLAILCEAAQLVGRVSRGDEDGFWASLTRVRDTLRETGGASRDFAVVLGLAGERAVQRGLPGCARAAFELSHEQWTRLGAAEEAAALQVRLGPLGDAQGG